MPHMKSLLLKALGLLSAFAVTLSLPAVVLAADSYPSKPIRLIIPVSPGGSVDTVGRLMASKLSERLGKQVVAENHAGAGGIIGTEMVAKANPDGYTLLFMSTTHTIQPALEKLPYDPLKAFIPIAKVASAANVLVVHPSVSAKSVKDLIALAKQKPGQLIFACGGIGSSNHMVTEFFKMVAGIDFKIVQFKGGGPALVDLLGGHSHGYLGSVMASRSHIQAGKLRALATCGAKRSVILPALPTMAEADLPGFTASTWWGFIAPAGTPAPIVDRLSNEIKAVLTLDELKKVFLVDGGEVDYLPPTEFGPFLEEEIDKWARVVKKANIKREQ